MKIINIIGARPQFIKVATVSREINKHPDVIREIIVHTGQHFDTNMSAVFFDELKIPEPHYNLGINSLTHGAMTGQMLEKIESVLIKEKPDYVLVYGDTNSTIAGALAARKLHIKIAHIEAGLRSLNNKMPEEINRILTDRISDILFCPTTNAVNNLINEGFGNFDCNVINSGDVMYDAALFYSQHAKQPDFEIPDRFILATIHRAENTDNIDRLKSIMEALNEISKKHEIILPVHPRTKAFLKNNNISVGFKLVEPVGYLEIIYLLTHCSLVMTDSGGLQKEAFFFKKPCVTLRDETEWTELTENGYNVLAGADKEKIINRTDEMINKKIHFSESLYGNGNASGKIINTLLKF